MSSPFIGPQLPPCSSSSPSPLSLSPPSPFNSPSSQHEEGDEEEEISVDCKDMFVGNLSLYTDEDKLRAHFAKFGKIADVRIMYHQDTNKSRRFGFVTFGCSGSMLSALSHPNHFLDGKTLDLKRAIKKHYPEGEASPIGPQAPPAAPRGRPRSPVPQNKVFVGGIGQDAEEEDLREYFSAFGRLESLVLLPDHDTGRHRGFAFITFDRDEAAEAVCKKRFHSIKGKTSEVKRAKPRRDDKGRSREVNNNSRRGDSPPEPLGLPPPPSLLGEHPLQALMNQALSSAVYTLQQTLAHQFQPPQHLPYWAQPAVSAAPGYTPHHRAAAVRYTPYHVKPQPAALPEPGTDGGGGGVYPVQSLLASASSAAAFHLPHPQAFPPAQPSLLEHATAAASAAAAQAAAAAAATPPPLMQYIPQPQTQWQSGFIPAPQVTYLSPNSTAAPPATSDQA